MKVVKEIHRVAPGILRWVDKELVVAVCQFNHLKMVEWLVSVCPLLDIGEILDELVHCQRNHTISWLYHRHEERFHHLIRGTHELEKMDECSICYGADVSLLTNCQHSFCQSCLFTWLKTHRTCPICRVVVETCQRLAIKKKKPEIKVVDLTKKKKKRVMKTQLILVDEMGETVL